MNPFEEDITNPECDGVYYQTPEELKVKHNPEPDVVHDDSLPSDEEDEKEKEDHHEDDDEGEEKKEDDDKEKEDKDHDDEHHDEHHDDHGHHEHEEHEHHEHEEHEHHHDHHHHDDCHHHDGHHFGHDMSPIEAIRRIKSDPATVSITKLNGKYYIDHNDLRCYMDACGEANYECALKNIIAANNDGELSSDNVGIVMGESDLLKLDPETKLAMESSDVNFEVYDN